MPGVERARPAGGDASGAAQWGADEPGSGAAAAALHAPALWLRPRAPRPGRRRVDPRGYRARTRPGLTTSRTARPAAGSRRPATGPGAWGRLGRPRTPRTGGSGPRRPRPSVAGPRPRAPRA